MRRLSPLLLLLVLGATSPGAAQQDRLKVGRIVEPPRGDVKGKAPDEPAPRPLKLSDEVVEKMEVRTGSRSSAKIQVGFSGPRGSVDMFPRSSLVFDKWLLEDDATLLVRVGACLFNLWPRKPGQEHMVRITTPKGTTLTLLGTSVFLQVAPDGTTSAFVLEGSVTMQSQSGDEVTIATGQVAHVTPGRPPTEPVSFTVSPGGDGSLPWLPGPGITDPPQIDLDDPRLDLPK